MKTLVEVAGQIEGRSFCALGDAAAWPVQNAVRVFPEEFEYMERTGRSMMADDGAALAMMP